MEETGKTGFAESNPNRKSTQRLNLIICAGICIFAALIEGVGDIVSTVKTAGIPDAVINQADWKAITAMVGTLLIGGGVVKGAQSISAKFNK